MTVTYLSQHRAVSESHFVAIKLDLTTILSFPSAQRHQFFKVSGVSYDSQDAQEQQNFYRESHQAAIGAKLLVINSDDYLDVMPTIGLKVALAKFERCIAEVGRGH